jgi:hypothetical protein
MSISIVHGDIPDYLYTIFVKEISVDILPVIRSKLQKFNNSMINDVIDEIIWILEYHLETMTEYIKQFLFDYTSIPLLLIECSNVINGVKQKCMLNTLNIDKEHNCIVV